MIRPSKHYHPDRSIINISRLLLIRLRACKIEKFDVLRKYAKNSVSGGEFVFIPALNFLYLMGLIEYRPKTDVIEYMGPNK
jgi:hypothetical protein